MIEFNMENELPESLNQQLARVLGQLRALEYAVGVLSYGSDNLDELISPPYLIFETDWPDEYKIFAIESYRNTIERIRRLGLHGLRPPES